MDDDTRKAFARACAYAGISWDHGRALVDDAATIIVLNEAKQRVKLTTTCAADWLGIKPSELRALAKAGRIPYEQINARVWRFRVCDLREFETSVYREKQPGPHNLHNFSVENRAANTESEPQATKEAS